MKAESLASGLPAPAVRLSFCYRSRCLPSFFPIFNVQNLADALNNLRRASVAVQNFVHVAVINVQPCILLHKVNQFYLLHSPLEHCNFRF
nr:MAG TPA: hypothetical protein [Caudoviricetes sp.]